MLLDLELQLGLKVGGLEDGARGSLGGVVVVGGGGGGGDGVVSVWQREFMLEHGDRHI